MYSNAKLCAEKRVSDGREERIRRIARERRRQAVRRQRLGLMLGRVGDAFGEMICIALAGRLPVQIAVTAILFAAATVVFFKVYNVLYVPETERVLSEREKFHYFAMEHDLSAREQDMLRLLLEQKTNSEIAGALFISENTVKFHIKNLLQKTGCKNRKELVAAYMAYSAEG